MTEDKGRSALLREEWTTGGVDNRRSGQQEEWATEEWTTGGVDNRLRIGTMDWNEPGEENKNNMIIIIV